MRLNACNAATASCYAYGVPGHPLCHCWEVEGSGELFFDEDIPRVLEPKSRCVVSHLALVWGSNYRVKFTSTNYICSKWVQGNSAQPYPAIPTYPNTLQQWMLLLLWFATFLQFWWGHWFTSSQLIAGVLDSRTQEQLAEFILMERVRLGFLRLGG